MSDTHFVLSNYPLSGEFRRLFEDRYNAAPTYLHVPELRRLPVWQLFRRLRTLHPAILTILLEDENASVVLPLMTILACISKADRLEVVWPDLDREHLYRREIVRASWSLLSASFLAYASMLQSRRELNELIGSSRALAQRRNGRKILYLHANLWFGVKAGGAVGHVAGVANGLLNSGFDVDLATASGRQMVSERSALIPLKPTTLGMPFETNYYRFSRTVVSHIDNLRKVEKYAFIYQRMSLGNYSGVLLSRRHDVPLVLEYNGSEVWISKHWGRGLRYVKTALQAEDVCLKHAHLIVTISEALRVELVQRGVPSANIVCYPNCIDPNMFDPHRITPAERILVRQRHGIPEGALIVEFVGTFGPWHGTEILAKAVRKLVDVERAWLEKHHVRFLIVGDGMTMPAVREILSSAGCEDFCKLVGLVPQSEAPSYLSTADVLISPHVPNPDGSAFFGSPTKLFEYMAMGKAIVASDLDQIGQILANSIRVEELPTRGPCEDDPRLSVLFPPGDVDALIAGLKFVIENPDWRAKLGTNARREALSRYTWRHHVTAILDKLRALGLAE